MEENSTATIASTLPIVHGSRRAAAIAAVEAATKKVKTLEMTNVESSEAKIALLQAQNILLSANNELLSAEIAKAIWRMIIYLYLPWIQKNTTNTTLFQGVCLAILHRTNTRVNRIVI